MFRGRKRGALVVRVANDKAALCDAAGWSRLRPNDNVPVFKVEVPGRYKGDDETALFNLLHRLPEGVTIDDLSVNWDASDY